MRKTTKGLFKEWNEESDLSIDDWRSEFVELEDITGYDFAELKFDDGWKGWQKFNRDWPFFKNKILPDWIAEIEVRIRSKAIKKIVNSKVPADQKWIAEGRYKPHADKRKKADKERERDIKKRVQAEVDDDVERVAQANVVKLERTS